MSQKPRSRQTNSSSRASAAVNSQIGPRGHSGVRDSSVENTFSLGGKCTNHVY